MKERFKQSNLHFHPKLISYQIMTLQLLFYCGMVVFGLFFNFLYSVKVMIHHELVFSLGQVFSFTVFTPLTEIDVYPTSAIFSLVFTSMAVIVALVDVVVKGNKVLDFVTTIVTIHFVICSAYDGFNKLNWTWTIYYGLWTLVTTLVGEYVCLRFEQREGRLTELLFKNNQRQYENNKVKVLVHD